jgi:hypothetical protein
MKIIAALLIASVPAIAGDFINLGFDQPNLSHVQTMNGLQQGPTSEVLQGWSLTIGNGVAYPPSTIISVGPAAPLSLYPAQNVQGIGPDLGKYSLFLGPVLGPPGQSFSPVYTLSQTGVIPANASSLQFLLSDAIAGLPPANLFQCQINGQSASLSVAPGIRPDILNADVSAFAGQQVNLSFVFGQGIFSQFDIAGFTTTPEPSTYALLGFCAALLWCGSRRLR